MGTENNNRATPQAVGGRHSVQFVYKDRATTAQGVDDKLVVDHFVTDIDGRTIDVKRSINDLDSPVNASAEPSWIGELDLGTGNSREIKLLNRAIIDTAIHTAIHTATAHTAYSSVNPLSLEYALHQCQPVLP